MYLEGGATSDEVERESTLQALEERISIKSRLIFGGGGGGGGGGGHVGRAIILMTVSGSQGQTSEQFT